MRILNCEALIRPRLTHHRLAACFFSKRKRRGENTKIPSAKAQEHHAVDEASDRVPQKMHLTGHALASGQLWLLPEQDEMGLAVQLSGRSFEINA